MKRLLFFVLIMLLGLAHAEIRALWVLPWNITNPAAIDAVIEDAIAHHQNELLLEVRYRSDALYTPNLLSSRYFNPEPRSYILNDFAFSFDPLQYAISQAKQRGLRVQAWLVTFNATPLDPGYLQQNYIYQQRRDWLTCDKEGNRMNSSEQFGYFLDPGIPEVQSYLLDVFSDIVESYPDLDGIHLDYVRYPSAKFGYHPISVSRYQAAKQDEELSWNEWRIRQVTEFVQKLQLRLKSIKPDIILSAAVFSAIYDARIAYGQDWFDWLNRGIIDLAYPMAYHVKYDAFVKQMQAMQDNGHTDKIVVGLRAWNAKGGSLLPRQSPSYNINHIQDRIRYLRQHDFAGIALFSYEGIIKDAALSLLADRVYPAFERLPERMVDAVFPSTADLYFHNTAEGYRLDLFLPLEGRWQWELRDSEDNTVYSRFRYYYKGLNQDYFDGLLTNGQPIPSGTYWLHLDKPYSDYQYTVPVIIEAL